MKSESKVEKMSSDVVPENLDRYDRCVTNLAIWLQETNKTYLLTCLLVIYYIIYDADWW